MPNIGIVGSGISGLTLALSLQRAGVDSVVYAERAQPGWEQSRLPSTVARYGPTMLRERSLGIDHWDGFEVGIERFELSVTGTRPAFSAAVPHGGSAVDFRTYLPRLLQDYATRGGEIVVATMDADAIRAAALRHDLIVVATGRESTHALFPRDPPRSVHDAPQRLVCAAVYDGVDTTSSPAIIASASPAAGEVLSFPFYSRERRRAAVLIEAIPDGPLQDIMHADLDDLDRFAAHTLRLLRDHAPTLAARVDPATFRPPSQRDVFRGAVTPTTVRRAWQALGADRYAVAIGDAWIANDPIAGQGANLGSACAARLAGLIVDHDRYDDQFCGEAERQLWAIAEPVCWWSNTMLAAPAHMLGVLEAAASDQAVADAFVTNMTEPAAMYDALSTEQSARAFVASAKLRQPAPTGAS